MSEPFEAQDELKLRLSKAKEKSRSLTPLTTNFQVKGASGFGPVMAFGTQKARMTGAERKRKEKAGPSASLRMTI
jgi:hypothetical protein